VYINWSKIVIPQYLYKQDKIDWSSKRKITIKKKDKEQQISIIPAYNYGVMKIKKINSNLTEFTQILSKKSIN
jgi:hypothetical protein